MKNNRLSAAYFQKAAGRVFLLWGMCLLLFLTNGTFVGATSTSNNVIVVTNENQLPSSGNIKLDNNIELSKAWQITGTVTLDLNGKTLSRKNLTGVQKNGEVILLNQNARITITDSKGGGQITGGYSSNTAGGIHAKSSSRIWLDGGSISGNKSTYYGGGVYLDSGAKLFINGGTISNNTAEYTYGGGVYADKDSEVHMSGGEISSNRVTGNYYGGGVYANKATCFFYGGKITSNSAQYGGGIYLYGASKDSSTDKARTTKFYGSIQIMNNNASEDGGGIFADNTSNLSITDGKITDNYAKRGGGVFVDDIMVGKCEITVGGSAYIIGNRASTELKNLTLDNGTLTSGANLKLDTFEPNAKIGIGRVSEGYPITHPDTDVKEEDARYFISDKSGQRIKYDTKKGLISVEGDRDLSVIAAVNEAGNPLQTAIVNKSTHTILIQLGENESLSDYIPRIKVGNDVKSIDPNGEYNAAKDPNLPYVYTITGSFKDNTPVILTLKSSDQEQNWELICSKEKTIVGKALVSANGAKYFYKTLDEAWNTVTSWVNLGYSVELTLFADCTVQNHLSLDGSQSSLPFPILPGKSSGNLTIDLNGHTINRNLSTSTANGNIMTLSNTTVTIKDSSASKKDSSVSKSGTITGGNSSNCGAITALNTTLTLKDVTLSQNASSGNGGAITAVNTALTLENVEISKNTAAKGSGIYASGGTLTINSGKITENQNGYAVYIDDNVSPTTVTKITGATISKNTAGGLYLANKAEMNNTNISENSNNSNGGGIYYKRKNTTSTVDDTLKIENCQISNNKAPNGAGIYLDSLSDSVNDITVSNCLISGNNASAKGGGIYTDAKQTSSPKNSLLWLKLNNCIITANTAPSGGGIYAASDGNSVNKLSCGGVTYIRENKTTSTANSNVMLANGSILTSEDTNYRLTGSASIGVSSDSQERVAITNRDSAVWSEENRYIVSDLSDHYVAFVPGDSYGNLYLVKGDTKAAITEFTFKDQTAPNTTTVIDPNTNRVTITMPNNSDLKDLTVKTFKVTSGATYTPATHPTDFSSPVVYTVKNGAFISQNWTIIVKKSGTDAYNVTVTDGKITSSAGDVTQSRCSVNKLVAIKADEISGKVFNHWEAEGVTLQNPTDMETGFIMPSNDVTLRAVYDTIVTDVDLTIDTPIAGQPLPGQARVKTGQTTEEEFDIHWNPDMEVKPFTSYEASVTIPTTKYPGYVFDSTTKIRINGRSAEGIINADGSITITGKLDAYAKLKEIKNPEPVSVPYGTKLKDIALPDTLAITLEGADNATASVLWQIGMEGDPILTPGSEEYDPDAKEYFPKQSGEQTFTGTVYLPAGVLTEDDKKITKTITINVGEQAHAGVPMADLSSGYYTENKTVSLTAAAGAQIYYTTDGTDPKTSSSKQLYTAPISLTGEEGKEITTTIRAYATETGKIDSETADFKYTIAIPVPTYTLTVTGGSGSGEYKAGEKVAIIADEKEGQTFYRWNVEGDKVILDNRYAKTTFFEMPAENVKVSAEYHDNIKSVELTVEEPKKGQALPLKAVWKITGQTKEDTEGISYAVLSWTPNSDKAAAYTTYTANIKLQADTENAYAFAETVTATVNNNNAFVTKNEDGTVTVTYSFTTEKAMLLGINQPADVSGIKNGTAAADIANSLPKVVHIKTDDGNKYAGVEWTAPSNDIYKPSNTAEQSFTVSGTVNLPQDTRDSQPIGIDVWINVTVNKADQAAAPVANVPSGTYAAELNVTLTSATEGAKIYYTTNGKEPEIETDGTPRTGTYQYTEAIDITGEAGKTKETIIKAVAKKDDKTQSPTVTYKYTITLPAKTYSVTVNNGTGSGKYKAGNSVIIMADAEKADQTFYRWTVTKGDTKPDNSRSKSTYFIMPEGDVEISAEFRDKIKRIDLNIDTPARNEKLPSQAECPTTGIAKTSLVWTPNDTTAGTYKTYTANIRIEADTENAYRFADNAVAYVNGNRAVLTTNEDGTVTATYRFTTEKAVLREIKQPEAVSGIANGTTMEKIIASLPQFATLNTNDGNRYGKVTWNATPVEGNYNPNRTTAQTFTLSGTVTLPEDTDNSRKIALSVQLKVTVSAAGITGAPVANIPGGEYPDELNVILTSTTDGAKIYYTTDGTTPTEASALYKKPIQIKGTPGKTVETTIKAIAVKDHMQASAVVTHTYRITLPAQTYTVTVNGGAGSGQYKAGSNVLIMADAAQKDKTFVKWNVVKGNAKPDNIYDAFAYFTMPEEDVEITAEFRDKISKVELNVTEPTTGISLPKDKPTWKTNVTDAAGQTGTSKGITNASLFWTPTDKTAGACKNYIASIRLEPDKADFYEFADNVTVTVNSKKAVVNKNEDGTITVIYSFTTKEATLESIEPFAPVSGIAKDTPAEKIPALLPQFAVLNTNDGQKYGKVTWTAPTSYVAGQQFTVSGTVKLPKDTANPDSKELTVKIQVTVSANSVGAPMPDIPAGTYPEELEVSLASATTGASIYYTTNSSINDSEIVAKGTKYTEPIKVKGKAGQTTKTTIRAVAVKKASASADQTSDVVTYDYTIKLPAKYTLTVINGKGGGKYEKDTEVTVMANAPEKNQTFIGWETSNNITLSEAEKTSQIITFKMPDEDVTVTALYRSKITAAELTIHAPEVGQPLDTSTITCSGAGIITPVISWNTKDTVAQYNTEYWAVITLTADSSNHYAFADSVALTVNGKKVTPRAATGGSLIAYASFKTAKAKLLTIENPSDITGENGASLAKILPKTVKIQTEGQLITEADAVWNIKEAAYKPNSSQTQKFTVTGTADIPKEIDTTTVGSAISVNVTIWGRYVPSGDSTPSPTPTAPVGPVGPIIPPTATPTADPGVEPVIPPSATPTVTPSATPTATPSQTPTAAPAVTPSPTPAVTPTMTPAVTPAITPSTAPTKTPATRRPTATPKPTAKAKVTYNFHTLKARTVKQGKTSVTLKWSKVSKADGYIIYGSRCSKGKTYKNKLLKTIKGNKTLTWTLKKLKKGTSYKYQVKAYRTVKGKKVITDKSIVVHAVTKGGKYCVPSKVQVTKLAGKKVKNPKKALSLTLKKGKTAKITAAAKPADKKKKLTRHRALCYESSNTKVAKVSKTGKVKAVKKGSCTIWVYAENGVYRTIKVKVK